MVAAAARSLSSAPTVGRARIHSGGIGAPTRERVRLDEGVLEVQVSAEFAVPAGPTADGEPRVAGSRRDALHLVGGHVRGYGDEAVQGRQHGTHVAFVEPQGAGEALVLALLEQPLAARLLDERGDLLAGVRAATSSIGRPRSRRSRVRHCVHAGSPAAAPGR